LSNSKNISQEEPFTINLKQIFYVVLKNWYWYLLSIFLCGLCGWLYLRYTPPTYTVRTSLLIKDDKNNLGGAANFLDGLELLSSTSNVQNEIEIVRSFNNIEQCIKELNFDISYYAKGNIKTGELYKKAPFRVQLDTHFVQMKQKPIYIEILSDSTFSVHPFNENDDTTSSQSLPVCKFGERCHSLDYSFIIHKTSSFSYNKSTKADYYFVINDIEELSLSYLNKLSIELTNKKSSILILSLNGLIPDKEIDFLNKLSEVYIENGLQEKNQIAINTIIFIDNQLNQITDSLQGAENKLEKFRTSEKIMDLGLAASNAFAQLEIIEKEHAALVVKDRYYHYLLDYLNYNYDIKKIIAPSAMGIEDPQLNNLIAELHTLNTEKTSLGFSTQKDNPTIHILELKVENTKKALIETLKNIIKASDIALEDNLNRLNRIQSLVNKLPSNERSLVNIQRRFLLNENIYNYLMQKRVEAGIAKAANLADNKVINKAKLLSKNPVSPKRTVILFLCFTIGLLIPSLWLYLKSILNDTITDKFMIEQQTQSSLIGSIPHYEKKEKLPVVSYPKSSVSEAIRSLRINLQYLAADKRNKVIGITSSISGEGKTFFSSNLAASIANSGAKIIIVDADLRKPKLNQSFDFPNEIGLSNYYINKANIPDIIQQTSVDNLHIITSGPVPPNPTNLLESNKTDLLFSYLLERYEYIIVDAPPVGLVSDYYLLSKYIDADLYLIRQNYSPKSILKDISALNLNKKIRNMYIVFNDVNYNGGYGGYGYYSGYGYYEEASQNKSFLNTLKKLFI